MSRYRWCGFCTHAFEESELVEDEYGLPACPYCGAPGMYLRAWNAVRGLFEEVPPEPVSGSRYRFGAVAAPSPSGVVPVLAGAVEDAAGPGDAPIG